MIITEALEENILKPLGTTRANSWLCDLLPESRLNPNQRNAIENYYNPLINEYNLNHVTIPSVPSIFCNERRCDEITRKSGNQKQKK